jgi:hypothetical protein
VADGDVESKKLSCSGCTEDFERPGSVHRADQASPIHGVVAAFLFLDAPQGLWIPKNAQLRQSSAASEGIPKAIDRQGKQLLRGTTGPVCI